MGINVSDGCHVIFGQEPGAQLLTTSQSRFSVFERASWIRTESRATQPLHYSVKVLIFT